MKKIQIYLILFIVFASRPIFSQTPKSFSSSAENTIPEMTSFFESANKSYKIGIDSMKTFFPEFWSVLSMKEQKAFLDLANQMLKSRKIIECICPDCGTEFEIDA